MAKKKSKNEQRFYWDANVFVSAINADAKRLPVIEAILDDCDQGESEVYTSMLSITEVAFAGTEKESRLINRLRRKLTSFGFPPLLLN